MKCEEKNVLIGMRLYKHVETTFYT